MTSVLEQSSRVIIIGAGHAGGSLAAFLRHFGFEGAITLVGEEPAAPYQRPPLSKAWLSGDTTLDKVYLRPSDWYEGANIDLRVSTLAVAIDREAKTVSLNNGETLSYDVLIIATGARARWTGVEGEKLGNVFSLRTVADAEALKAAIKPNSKAVLVGAGYIGLEVAASLRKAGAQATVLERETRALARVASEPIAHFLAGYHQEQGVSFQFEAGVEQYLGDGAVAGVALKDGSRLDCDIAVVGIGVVPNDELARDAGLKCSNGIEVDEGARTSDSAIFAIGDVSFRPLALYGCQVRLESVPNALEQARCVASALCGRPSPAPEVPWFWSDQYDIKIQIAGLTLECDETVVRGNPETKKFAVFHLCGGVIRAVEAINGAPEFMMGRKLIAAKKSIPAARLADLDIPMKEFLA